MLMTKTPEDGERIEEQPEEHQLSLQEPKLQKQAAEEDLKRVIVEPYFPEVFLG
jgi:hypothetical protein